MVALEYANETGRPSSPVVAALGRVIPGIATVQAQHQPYAEAWHAANLAAIARPGPRWIVLGDSMSHGVGASRFDAGWVNRVRDRLAEHGQHYELINLSANGARASDVLEQQLPAWRALSAAPGGAGDDIVTLLVGSNDLFSRRHRDQLPATYARLLRELPRRSVIALMPQPRPAARAVNELILAARAERGVGIVDMRSTALSSWRGRLAADHFHPNDLGYQAIADAFYAPIADWGIGGS